MLCKNESLDWYASLCRLGALKRQVDLQGVFSKINDFIQFEWSKSISLFKIIARMKLLFSNYLGGSITVAAFRGLSNSFTLQSPSPCSQNAVTENNSRLEFLQLQLHDWMVFESRTGEMKVSTSTVAALFSKMALTGQRIAMVDMVLLYLPAFPYLP